MVGHLHDNVVPAGLQGEIARVGPVYRFVILPFPRNPALARGMTAHEDAVGHLDGGRFQSVCEIRVVDHDPEAVGRRAQRLHAAGPRSRHPDVLRRVAASGVHGGEIFRTEKPSGIKLPFAVKRHGAARREPPSGQVEESVFRLGHFMGVTGEIEKKHSVCNRQYGQRDRRRPDFRPHGPLIPNIPSAGTIGPSPLPARRRARCS